MSEKMVQLNEEVTKGQLKELVRGSVEEALNGLLALWGRCSRMATLPSCGFAPGSATRPVPIGATKST